MENREDIEELIDKKIWKNDLLSIKVGVFLLIVGQTILYFL